MVILAIYKYNMTFDKWYYRVSQVIEVQLFFFFGIPTEPELLILNTYSRCMEPPYLLSKTNEFCTLPAWELLYK